MISYNCVMLTYDIFKTLANIESTSDTVLVNAHAIVDLMVVIDRYRYSHRLVIVH